MNTITFLSLIAPTSTGLALVHDAGVRRAARNIACRAILALRRYCKAHDHARDTQ